MENASKALIIAGAILVSILLISLGILIYNQATSITNNQQMDEVEKTTFNSKFTQYEGTKVTAAQVRALSTQVVSSNSSEDNATRPVHISGPNGYDVTGTEITSTGSIVNSARYSVSCGYSDQGIVNEITITEN